MNVCACLSAGLMLEVGPAAGRLCVECLPGPARVLSNSNQRHWGVCGTPPFWQQLTVAKASGDLYAAPPSGESLAPIFAEF